MPAGLVLLHGFTQTGRSWDAVRGRLAERYRPLTPELRGHGTAAAARPVDLASVLGDLDGLIADDATLAGYSMGGRVALHWALSRPGRLARLVLIGASPGLAGAAERAGRRTADEALARRVEEAGVAAFAEEWASLPLFAGQPPEVRAAAHADRLRQTPAGLAAALRGLGTGVLPSLWDRLGEADVPVDLVVGERDEKFRAVAEEMARALPRARVTVVPRAGHAVHLEDPAAVARVLSDDHPGW